MDLNVIHNEDCLEGLKKLPDNCIDTIITDPPYGLSFMGKKWDYDLPSADIWKECLRVLKHGGTALIFGGSRTYHRMAVSVEDAGFDIRDCIMWIYGSGFPKSYNIGKGIDKIYPRLNKFNKFAEHFETQRKTKQITQKEIAKLFPSKTGGLTECVWNWENGSNIPTLEQYKILKPLLDFSDEFDNLIEREEAEREVIGKSKSGIGTAFGDGEWLSGKAEEVDITLPATEKAKEWEGWGTALKPAYEPIIVAMKPVDKNFVNNALTWGVAGYNIDGARIGFQNETDKRVGTNEVRGEKQGLNSTSIFGCTEKGVQMYKEQGRFPANVILECICETQEHTNPECPCYMLDEQSGISKSEKRLISETEDINIQNKIYGKGYIRQEGEHNDKGGASRFFYTAKASKSERNKGCEELEEKAGGSNAKGYTQDIARGLDRNRPTTNFHPTVKPMKLMEYLCKLTRTPTGGIVLDPFIGSGTTACACITTDRKFIGFEREAEYCEIANARIKAYQDKQNGKLTEYLEEE